MYLSLQIQQAIPTQQMTIQQQQLLRQRSMLNAPVGMINAPLSSPTQQQELHRQHSLQSQQHMTYLQNGMHQMPQTNMESNQVKCKKLKIYLIYR